MEKLIDKKDVAAWLSISTVSVDRLRRTGKLPYRKIGGLIKFLPEDLERFLANAKCGDQK